MRPATSTRGTSAPWAAATTSSRSRRAGRAASGSCSIRARATSATVSPTSTAARLDSELGLEASDRVLAWLPAGHELGRDRHRARQHGLALQHRRGPRQPRVLRVLRPRREPPHGPHRGRGKEKLLDLSEAPLAYKDIDEVMAAQADLVRPLVKLRPLAAVKG